MKPFANESDVIQINGLTIENRTDRVSLFGSLDVARDRTGLQQARQLSEIINTVLLKLEEYERAGRLPDQVRIEGTVTVNNPLT